MNPEQMNPEQISAPSSGRQPLSFVRRSGRMSEGQERAWEQLSTLYRIEVERGEGTTSVAETARIEPAHVWGRTAPLIAEIGSGQGHAIVHAATEHPETNFLAIDVFRAGLARTMLGAESAGAEHLRVVEANAPEVLAHLLPPQSLDEVWVFFPDPWHKHRHNKRRLVTDEFANRVAGSLRAGGVLRLATDWEAYARQMRTVLDGSAHFERDFDGEWAPRYPGRVLTAFENKGQRAGRQIRDLSYRRTVFG